jgi:hypothetical protein
VGSVASLGERLSPVGVQQDGYLIVGEEIWNPETDLQDFADNLDRSMNRWRNIYRSARTLLSRATAPAR